MVGQKFFDWTPDGGYGRSFGWKFWNNPRLGESKGFLVGKHEIDAPGETDGDVFGGLKDDVSRSNVRVWDLRMCGMGARWDQWTVDCSGVANPAAVGVWQICGQEMRCQINGKGERHRLPYSFLAPGDKNGRVQEKLS